MTVVLYVLLVGAVVTDLKKQKIYNLWVLPGLSAGIMGAGLFGGSAGLRQAVISCLLTFFLLFPVYLVGGIGAGDVKLFTAAAAWLDTTEVFTCLLLAFLVGGVFAVSHVILMPVLQAAECGKGPAVFKDTLERVFGRHQKGRIRFAVPILISVVFLLGGKL